MASRLNILMKMFAITGKDLSELIHVDSSLISKWRSGKRSLKPKSIYVDKIVTYFMELDKPQNYVNICKLLANDYENIFSCSEKEIAIFLKSWLTCKEVLAEQDSQFEKLKNMGSAKISMFYKFIGNKGRRQAVRFLLDYAIAHSPGLEILSFTEEDASWFYEDADFLKEWGEKNYRLLQNGSFVKVIHPVDRTYENTATSMLKWLPLHMTGKTRAFYIPRYTDNPIGLTMFLIPNHLTIFNMSSKTYNKGINTLLTNDCTFLESVNGVLQEYFDKSIPIFKRYGFKTNVDYLNDLIGILEAEKEKFFYSSTFSFLPLSEELVKEILQHNNVSPEKISKYGELSSIIHRLNLRATSRYIINLEKIREQFNKERVVLDSFSFLLGKEISVSQKLYVKIVREAINNILGSNRLEIGMTNSNTLVELANINILAQENTCVLFFSAALETPLCLGTTELTVVISIFHRLEKIWEAIPRLYRNKEFVCKQLQELLDKCR